MEFSLTYFNETLMLEMLPTYSQNVVNMTGIPKILPAGDYDSMHWQIVVSTCRKITAHKYIRANFW